MCVFDIRRWRRRAVLPPASFRSLVFVSATCAALLCASDASKANEAAEHHEHPAVTVDENLNLSLVVEHALEHYPTTLELAARDAQAQAWRKRGRSWLADRPSLAFRYQTDRYWVDNNLEEYEPGLSLPLWQWGGRSATQTLGNALTEESATARRALQWEVAGLVRQTVWDIALAENQTALAEEALDIATRLSTVLERRYELGDVALGDVLMAQSARLEAETALVAARAGLLDAERAYRSLTALEARPPFARETLSSLAEINAEHPALAFVDAEVRRAEASRAVAERAGKTGPTLYVSPRFERPAFSDAYDESVGVAIDVPFGGAAHIATDVAAAGREVAAAFAERERQARTLDLQMHEAAHMLDLVQRNLATANERAELAARHYAMAQTAFDRGELELGDLMKLQNTALTAKRQVNELVIEDKRSTAFYNQAVGVIP